MPRGGHKVVKPAKASQPEASNPLRDPSVPSFLSRNSSATKLSGSAPEPTLARDAPQQHDRVSELRSTEASTNPSSTNLPNSMEQPSRPGSSRTSSAESIGQERTYEAALDALEDLTIEETQSSASSTYSRDSSSIYSKDSASRYSSASSIYSSGASVYSFVDYGSEDSTEVAVRETECFSDSRLPGGLQYQQRTRSAPSKRSELQDSASRERSALAKKAAMFKNSRLRPGLPSFNTSLPAWSMVCRAAHASQDCYDSQALTRRGTYTPADTSKDIKAMIVDEQLIDESQFVVVAIRGTQAQSLTDWAVNKDANPVKPVGFLDDEENACHAGFLQVTKAMATQVAAQLSQHPASSQRPKLLFTGHSAGGAVAAMLYSHMVSTTVDSELTALASLFPSINCVTFGAPPLSLSPLPKRDHACGVFLSFANEGDPVLRLSNAAYVKSLAKLLTASPSTTTAAAVAPPPVKVVRGSRGATVYRQTLPVAPSIPWEELPVWPTPPAPLTNAGDVILLRDHENGSSMASRVTSDDLADVIFGDLVQHTVEMYIRRVKGVALAAMTGRGAI